MLDGSHTLGHMTNKAVNSHFTGNAKAVIVNWSIIFFYSIIISFSLYICSLTVLKVHTQYTSSVLLTFHVVMHLCTNPHSHHLGTSPAIPYRSGIPCFTLASHPQLASFRALTVIFSAQSTAV
jgi:hypothetical protein